MKVVKFENGMTVIAHYMPIDVEVVYMLYNVGAKNERPGMYGGSHLVEHMLFRRIEGLKASIDELLDPIGGYNNGVTDYDYTAYIEIVPVEHFELALEIERLRMTNAVFDPAEFELERRIVLSEFDMYESDTDFKLAYRASLLAWDTHPYRYMVIGVRRDLERVSRDELYSYYRRYYNPSNAILTCVGGIEEDKAVNLAMRYFVNLESWGVKGHVEPWSDGVTGRVRIRLRAAKGELPRILIAFRLPGMLNRDEFKMSIVTDFVLSGGRPYVRSWTSRETHSIARSARLYRLVEEGLASKVSSNYDLTLMDGLYLVYAYEVRDFDKVTERLVEIACEPLRPDEAEAVKRRIISFMYYMTDSASKAAQAYAIGQFAYGDPKAFLALMREIVEFDPREYQEFIERVIDKALITVEYG